MSGLVSLPIGQGWHFVRVDSIIAIKFVAPKKSLVVLTDNVLLDVSEDTHVINKRIEDFLVYLKKQP